MFFSLFFLSIPPRPYHDSGGFFAKIYLFEDLKIKPGTSSSSDGFIADCKLSILLWVKRSALPMHYNKEMNEELILDNQLGLN